MIVDIVAAVALLIGAVLAALGGIGLFRFPDVFTRMHAATKIATVGVIGTTAAAALEAGATSGLLVLLLVIVLLFLSAPLAMSLLAHAAYHDPQTTRVATGGEVDGARPAAQSVPAERSGGPGLFLAAWLFVVWVALFGATRGNVLIGGALVAAGIAYLLRGVALSWPAGLRRPGHALRFAGHFISQSIAGTWDVVRLLARPPAALRPTVIEVPIRLATRNEAALLMNAISFTPGTVALELDHDRLYVHALSSRSPAAVLAGVDALQELIAAAFGSPGKASSGSRIR